MIAPLAPSIAHHTSATSTIDTLLDDAAATPHLTDPAILRRSKARLSYIRERLGVSTPILSLSPREIEEQVHIVTAQASTDDSTLDEDLQGVTVEPEVIAAFDEVTDVVPDRESSILLGTAERRQLTEEVSSWRARYGMPLGWRRSEGG